MSDDSKKVPTKSTRQDVSNFLEKLQSAPVAKSAASQARLIFAMDATASRAPTWDKASRIQAEMFLETAKIGKLNIQLCYYGGFYEFHATPWFDHAEPLIREMTKVMCQSGNTQIERVLRHAIDETRRDKVRALVLVGDCVEEDPLKLEHFAGQLALLGVPVFLFQEGHDPVAEATFRAIARITSGAYSRFDSQSAPQLRELLLAVAMYAVGGKSALQDFSKEQHQLADSLVKQLPSK